MDLLDISDMSDLLLMDPHDIFDANDLKCFEEFEDSLCVWTPSVQSPSVVAAYRIAVVYYHHHHKLSPTHTVNCAEVMNNALTDAEQINVLRSYFRAVKNVVFGEDVEVEFPDCTLSHFSLFGTKVGMFDTFANPLPTNKHYCISAQMDFIQSGHTFSKKDNLTFVLTHFPDPDFPVVLKSWMRLDQIIFGFTPTKQRRRFPKPTQKDIEQLFHAPKQCVNIKSFQHPKLAKTAFDTLQKSMENQEIKGTILESAKHFAKPYDKVVMTITDYWIYITEFFHILHSYHNQLAREVWKMFLTCVLDCSNFTLACIKIGPMQNSYPYFGTSVEHVPLDLLRSHKKAMETKMTKMVISGRKLKKCEPTFRHFLIPSLFCKTHQKETPVGKPFNGIDLDTVLAPTTTTPPKKRTRSK